MKDIDNTCFFLIPIFQVRVHSKSTHIWWHQHRCHFLVGGSIGTTLWKSDWKPSLIICLCCTLFYLHQYCPWIDKLLIEKQYYYLVIYMKHRSIIKCLINLIVNLCSLFSLNFNNIWEYKWCLCEHRIYDVSLLI